jgi:hypothetical protein
MFADLLAQTEHAAPGTTSARVFAANFLQMQQGKQPVAQWQIVVQQASGYGVRRPQHHNVILLERGFSCRFFVF